MSEVISQITVLYVIIRLDDGNTVTLFNAIMFQRALLKAGVSYPFHPVAASAIPAQWRGSNNRGWRD
jgi:hypothetical protein